MPRFAVSHIDWFDYDLITIIVEATDWHDALHKHPKIALYSPGTFDGRYEDAQKAAFDCDSMINVTEIP